jgi:hypothetical protein
VNTQVETTHSQFYLITNQEIVEAMIRFSLPKGITEEMVKQGNPFTLFQASK